MYTVFEFVFWFEKQTRKEALEKVLSMRWHTNFFHTNKSHLLFGKVRKKFCSIRKGSLKNYKWCTYLQVFFLSLLHNQRFFQGQHFRFFGIIIGGIWRNNLRFFIFHKIFHWCCMQKFMRVKFYLRFFDFGGIKTGT